LEIKLTARRAGKLGIDVRADAVITVPERPAAGRKKEHLRVSSRVTIPSGGTAVFGGMKVDSRFDPSHEETAPVETRYVVIFVRPKFIPKSVVENLLFGAGYDRPTQQNNSP
jgi:hypothetical protein